MKDHEIAELVNHLRDIAVAYHDTEQLRARIAYVVVPKIKELNEKIQLLVNELSTP